MTIRKEINHKSRHVYMPVTKRGMTGSVPQLLLVVHQGVAHSVLSKSPTLLRVVGTGFTGNERLY